MPDETPGERNRRLARMRQQRRRDYLKSRRIASGAEKRRYEFFAGTLLALETIRTAGDCDLEEEALVKLIHGAADLLSNDAQAFMALMHGRRREQTKSTTEQDTHC